MIRTSGITTLELIIGLFATGILMVALGWLFGVGTTAQTLVYDGSAQADYASGPLNSLGDHLRDAQCCQSANGCTSGVQNSVISAASSNDVTYYSDGTQAAGSPVRYHLLAAPSGYEGPFALVRTVGSNNTYVLYGITSLTLTYYKTTNYNSATFSTTTNANAPTTAELPNLAAIRITANAVLDGRTVQYSTFVRLRNSPIKVNLID